MAYDSAREVVVLFGGYDYSSGDRNDTWEWEGTTWTQVADSGPSPRRNHAMAYDSARGVTVLFGGYDDWDYHNDTWEWDGATWTQVADSGPSGRHGHAMAYDSARGVVVLFGGYDGMDPANDTWEWDGTIWTQVADSGPTRRYGHAMAYDGARGVTVLFGGDQGAWYRDDTWEWAGPLPAPLITQHPADLTLDVGQPAVFTVAADSAWPLTYQWRKDAVPLIDDERISGATTPTLTIDPVEAGDAGDYDAVVSLSCGGVTSDVATLTVTGAIPGDVDGDGDVDLADLAALLSAYGACTGDPDFNPAADFDNSGCVDLADLATLLSNYGVGT